MTTQRNCDGLAWTGRAQGQNSFDAVQVFDVAVDRINKPYLPLASGEWSVETGIAVAASTGAAALLAGGLSGSWPLMATLAGSLALGIAYSTDVPFLRWKRYPLLAAGCILSVRYIALSLSHCLPLDKRMCMCVHVGQTPAPLK